MTQTPMPLAAVQLYGVLIAAAVGVGVWLCVLEEKRLPVPQDTGYDLALYAVPPAVVFARLYYVAFTWDAYRDNLLSILYVWEGGLAIYGAVLGGALGVFVLSRRKRIPLGVLADMTAPSLILGQAIGRWGNYFNGEAYGYEVIDPRWQFFPVAVQVDGTWHMATFFYESVWNMAGFAFLYLNRKRFQQKGYGHVFLWYIVWYGLGRMLIESLRTDSLMLGSLRVSQLLSVVACAVAQLAMARRAGGRAAALSMLLSVAGVTVFIVDRSGWALLLSALMMAMSAVALYRLYRQGDVVSE
jgi:phosphatidylglycerol:prolipoprotein diacylglycerol transferase